MNTQHDHQHHPDEGREIGRALHDAVDSMADSPLGVDDVRDRAHVLRRNRRVVAGVGLAAAAVILVPTALVAGNGLRDSGAPPAASATPAPSATPSPTPTDLPDPTPARTQPFDVSDLPTGAAPALAWAEGTTIHRADGSTVTLTGLDGIHQLAPMGDGWVVATDDGEGNLEAVLVDADGAAGTRFPLDGSLATSPGGQVVAWASPSGEVSVLQSGGAETLSMPPLSAPGPYSAVAVTGEDCQEGRTSATGCSVVVNTRGRQPQSYLSSSHGIVDRVGAGIVATTAALPPLTAGITTVLEAGTCSVVTDSAGPRWETCDYRVLGFAPDGEHAVAVGAYGDGFSDRELALLEAGAGTALVHLLSTEPQYAGNLDQVWEDESHVLVVTYQDGEWAIVRIGLDGSMEYAVPPVRASDMDRPLFLQVR